MVGRRSFPFGSRPIFRCYEKISGRVDVNFFHTRGMVQTHTNVSQVTHFFFRLPAASLSVFSHLQVAIKCTTELFCEVKSNTLTRPRCKLSTYDQMLCKWDIGRCNQYILSYLLRVLAGWTTLPSKDPAKLTGNDDPVGKRNSFSAPLFDVPNWSHVTPAGETGRFHASFVVRSQVPPNDLWGQWGVAALKMYVWSVCQQCLG